MTSFKTLALAALATAVAGSAVATGASAETYFQAAHPRRTEITNRLAVQNFRIRQERREGLISPRRAAMLHLQDRTIRHEERIDARFDRSHVTRGEDRALNRHENRVNREINRRY